MPGFDTRQLQFELAFWPVVVVVVLALLMIWVWWQPRQK